ncbi:hypothetical protein SCALM49S_06985 [Streptomyces californicus]
MSARGPPAGPRHGAPQLPFRHRTGPAALLGRTARARRTRSGATAPASPTVQRSTRTSGARTPGATNQVRVRRFGFGNPVVGTPGTAGRSSSGAPGTVSRSSSGTSGGGAGREAGTPSARTAGSGAAPSSAPASADSRDGSRSSGENSRTGAASGPSVRSTLGGEDAASFIRPPARPAAVRPQRIAPPMIAARRPTMPLRQIAGFAPAAAAAPPASPSRTSGPASPSRTSGPASPPRTSGPASPPRTSGPNPPVPRVSVRAGHVPRDPASDVRATRRTGSVERHRPGRPGRRGPGSRHPSRHPAGSRGDPPRAGQAAAGGCPPGPDPPTRREPRAPFPPRPLRRPRRRTCRCSSAGRRTRRPRPPHRPPDRPPHRPPDRSGRPGPRPGPAARQPRPLRPLLPPLLPRPRPRRSPLRLPRPFSARRPRARRPPGAPGPGCGAGSVRRCPPCRRPRGSAGTRRCSATAARPEPGRTPGGVRPGDGRRPGLRTRRADPSIDAAGHARRDARTVGRRTGLRAEHRSRRLRCPLIRTRCALRSACGGPRRLRRYAYEVGRRRSPPPVRIRPVERPRAAAQGPGVLAPAPLVQRARTLLPEPWADRQHRLRRRVFGCPDPDRGRLRPASGRGGDLAARPAAAGRRHRPGTTRPRPCPRLRLRSRSSQPESGPGPGHTGFRFRADRGGPLHAFRPGARPRGPALDGCSGSGAPPHAAPVPHRIPGTRAGARPRFTPRRPAHRHRAAGPGRPRRAAPPRPGRPPGPPSAAPGVPAAAPTAQGARAVPVVRPHPPAAPRAADAAVPVQRLALPVVPDSAGPPAPAPDDAPGGPPPGLSVRVPPRTPARSPGAGRPETRAQAVQRAAADAGITGVPVRAAPSKPVVQRTGPEAGAEDTPDAAPANRMSGARSRSWPAASSTRCGSSAPICAGAGSAAADCTTAAADGPPPTARPPTTTTGSRTAPRPAGKTRAAGQTRRRMTDNICDERVLQARDRRQRPGRVPHLLGAGRRGGDGDPPRAATTGSPGICPAGSPGRTSR